MEEIVCSYNSKTTDVTLLTFAAIWNDIIMNWQQCSSKGKQRQQHQGINAKKLLNMQ